MRTTLLTESRVPASEAETLHGVFADHFPQHDGIAFAGTHLIVGARNMADVTPQEWLESWVQKNIRDPCHIDKKASLRDEAEACADTAVSTRISITPSKKPLAAA